jgi:protein-tyrosine phosphatase
MTSELPQADLMSEPISGIARAAVEAGGDGFFSVPLISEVLPGLWQGGCIDGTRLPDDFDLVVSLYPWQRYKVGPSTRVVEKEAYDADDVPDVEELVELAYVAWKEKGWKVLIHCQAGLNRSGLVAAQVLMRDGYTAANAIALLREKRSSVVLCNRAFESWLLER